VLTPDGTLNRVRRSIVLGTLKEIPTRRQARALVDARLYEINQGLHRPRPSILFREFVSSLWEPTILPTLKFSTQRNYQHLTRRHLLPVFGDRPLSDIERVHVQGFVTNKVVRQKLSWKTALHLRNLLSKILGTAVEWGYLQGNAARGVKLPPRERRRPQYFLTQDQVGRLLQELKEPLRTLVLTAVLTGLRIGELLALRWCNVDFDRKVIRVREAVYEGHFSTPKTQSSQRDVPMGPLLQQTLCQHRTRTKTLPVDALVFASRSGSPFRPGNLLRRHLRPSCEVAGLPPISWHAFRHTHATLLSDLGEPLKTAQAQLGHASFTTTAEIYAHAVPASQRAAVEKLEQAVLGSELVPYGPKFASATVH
jgi:integrase